MGIKLTGNAKMTMAGDCYIGPMWQPMEKAPEEIGVEVLIWDERKFITIGELKDYGWDDASSGQSLDPIFWMPLPNPPGGSMKIIEEDDRKLRISDSIIELQFEVKMLRNMMAIVCSGAALDKDKWYRCAELARVEMSKEYGEKFNLGGE